MEILTEAAWSLFKAPSPQRLPLNGVPELRITLKHILASIRPRILSFEDHRIDNHNQANQTVRSNAEGNSKIEIL